MSIATTRIATDFPSGIFNVITSAMPSASDELVDAYHFQRSDGDGVRQGQAHCLIHQRVDARDCDITATSATL